MQEHIPIKIMISTMAIEFINPVMSFAIFSLIFRLHRLNRQIVNSHIKNAKMAI